MADTLLSFKPSINAMSNTMTDFGTKGRNIEARANSTFETSAPALSKEEMKSGIYNAWQSSNILNNSKKLKTNFHNNATKLSSEVDKNMDQVTRYSPDYKMKKINNYDNNLKNSSR